MYGKGAQGNNQEHLYWTVKEESSKITWVQNWKTNSIKIEQKHSIFDAYNKN